MWNFAVNCFWPWNSLFYSSVWPKFTFLFLKVPMGGGGGCLFLLSFFHRHLTSPFSVDDHHMLCETEKRNKKEERAQEWWVYFFIFKENNARSVSGQKWLKHLFHPLTFSFLDISRFFTFLKQYLDTMFYIFKYFAILNISSINSII